jgi:hypothetical protein
MALSPIMLKIMPTSQRSVFTASMTILATVFGCVTAALQIGGQSDIVFDLLKIGSVIAIGTALVSYVVWTALRFWRENLLTGGLAGLLTSLVIVPLPVFASALKNGVMADRLAGDPGLIGSVLGNLIGSIETGFLTFEVATKASLLAVIASACLGVLVAKFVPQQRLSPTD